LPPSGGFFAVALRLSSSAASAPVFLGSYQHAGLTEAPPDDDAVVVVPPSDPPDADVVVTSNENATT